MGLLRFQFREGPAHFPCEFITQRLRRPKPRHRCGIRVDSGVGQDFRIDQFFGGQVRIGVICGRRAIGNDFRLQQWGKIAARIMDQPLVGAGFGRESMKKAYLTFKKKLKE